MVSRGSCYFSDKTWNAMKAGAAGLIIASSDDQFFRMSAYESQESNLPVSAIIGNTSRKFAELMDDAYNIIVNDTPYSERKIEEDKYTIPSFMVTKKSSRIIIDAYSQQIEKAKSEALKELHEKMAKEEEDNKNGSSNNKNKKKKKFQPLNFDRHQPIKANLSVDIIHGNKDNSEKPIELQYDNKIIHNIIVIKTRRENMINTKATEEKNKENITTESK